ncbi:MAG: hypothetical protein NTY02_08855 [Acidobacteria bacterium]|nr:hypothetical protein [Acidobacteriota bacterium]
MRKLLLVFLPFFLVALMASPNSHPLSAAADIPVPITTVQNPLVGFSIDLPEDYEVTTGFDGETQMAINGTYIASVFSPWYYFTYTSQPPGECARLLEYLLRQPPLRSTTEVLQGTSPGEVILKATIPLEGVGTLEGRWVFRTESHKNYVVAAVVFSQLAGQYQQEIDRTLKSCRVQRHMPFSLHQEQTEAAYKIRLPEGWKWEGKIFRDPNIPGAFDWKATTLNGGAGCFNAAPVRTMTALDAQTAATTILPQYFQTTVAGFQFESYRPHPRASQQGESTFAVLFKQGGLRVGYTRGTGFYRATVAGVPLRFQIEIAVERVDLPLGSSAVMRTYGFWGPAQDFARLYTVARGVLGSLRESREWMKTRDQYAEEVLDFRQKTFEKILNMRQSKRKFTDKEGNNYDVDMTNMENTRVFKGKDGQLVYVDGPEAESKAQNGDYTELTAR